MANRANRANTAPIPRIAVVTGAGGGLGTVFCQALARNGWVIAALGRTEATLQSTIDSLENHTCSHSHSRDCSQGHAHSHSIHICDITDADAVNTTFDRILAQHGRIDLLVNNAGVPGPTGPIDDIDPADFHTTITTNFLGTVHCSQAAFRAMKRSGGGRIINNGSIAAHAPRPEAAAYAASKAAIASLTTSLSLDGRGHNITATELDIGNARTDLLGSFTNNEPMFDAAHAGNILATIAELPLNVSADHLTITAAGMPYLGRG